MKVPGTLPKVLITSSLVATSYYLYNYPSNLTDKTLKSSQKIFESMDKNSPLTSALCVPQKATVVTDAKMQKVLKIIASLK